MPYKSTYPPRFSSTLTYENRYDLDEIDVFLQGTELDSMFFNVAKLPNILGYGKHYFSISMKDSSKTGYHLKNGSTVLFEFKSYNNVIIYSDVARFDDKSGMGICYVDVTKDPMRSFDEIYDGPGTFIIAGELTHNDGYQPLPKKWRNVINYKCVFPIDIRKSSPYSNSPIISSTEHRKETFGGPFSFISRHFSVRADQIGPANNKEGELAECNGCKGQGYS